MPVEPTPDEVVRVMTAMSARANQPRPAVCAQCGKEFVALRPRGRFCSASCRVRASQVRKRAASPPDEAERYATSATVLLA